ncbi:hypothetical protein [Chloroflexus sp.]|uniref:hypothetical protein n=1 Tax=Chloroflexus sp. TaxID=1904827 RepID=UPI002ACD81E4|nr:hypothetical protein [Chloroflexus sp.]
MPTDQASAARGEEIGKIELYDVTRFLQHASVNNLILRNIYSALLVEAEKANM